MQAQSTIDVEALLEHAQSNAPALQRAQVHGIDADAQAVAAEMRIANPELDLSAGVRAGGGDAAPDFSVSVSQQIELGGARRARLDAAAALQDGAALAVEATDWQLHVEVHRLWVDVLLAQEALDQAQQFVAFSERLHEVAERQVAAGERSPLILLVTEADVAASREAEVTAAQMLAEYRATLAATVGWPGELPQVVGTLPPVRSLNSAVLARFRAAEHPAIVAMTAQIEASERLRMAETRAGRIDPTIGATYGREGGATATHIWTVDFGIPIPSARRNQDGIAAASAQASRQTIERDDAAYQLRAALDRAIIAVESAIERVQLYQDGIIPRFEENLALLERAYSLGEVDVHQVSQTRGRLLEASAEFLSARVNYYEAIAQLEGLIGEEVCMEAQQ